MQLSDLGPWLERLRQISESEALRAFNFWMLLAWTVFFGLRLGLLQRFRPRGRRWLLDLPNDRDQPFAPHPHEFPMMIGIAVSSCFHGGMSPWTSLAVILGGYFCGTASSWFLSTWWLLRAQPQAAVLWSVRLRRMGLRTESLSILEVYAGLEPRDYQNPARLAAALRGRLGWVVSTEPRYPLAMADAMLAAGEYKISCLFEAILGLDSASYETPGTFARLRRDLEDRLSTETAAKYLANLANSLWIIGRPEQGLAVLEDGFGPAPWSLPLPVNIRLQIALAFMSLLEATGRSREGLRLFESFLGLPGGDYTDPALSSRFVAVIRELPEEDQISTGTLFTTLLDSSERKVEAGTLLSTWLGVSGELADVERTVKLMKPLSPSRKAAVVQLLAGHWVEAGRPAAAVLVLEQTLDLRGAYYASGERLQKCLKLLPVHTAGICVIKLAVALAHAGRSADALKLATSFLWLSPEKYRHEERLRRALDERLETLPVEIRALFVNILVFRFLEAGRSSEAIRLAQTYLGLAPDDWADPARVAETLTSRLSGVSGTSASHCLDTLATALETAGRPVEAALVLDIWLFLWVRPGEVEPADGLDPAIFCSLFDRWLRCFGPAEHAIAVCHALVPRLRQSLAETAVTLADRRRFIEVTAELRRRIVETGLHRLETETDPAVSTDVRLDTLLWDLELGQRILLERFLAGSLPAMDGPGELVAGWSLGSAAEALGPLGAAALTLADRRPARRSPEPQAGGPRLPWLDEARELVHRGLSADRLASLLPASTILVRALFLSDGRLVWNALGGDRELRILAHGTGQVHDRFQVRWLNAVHDLRIAAVWLRLTSSPRGWFRAVAPLLSAFRDGLASNADPERLAALAHDLEKSGGSRAGHEVGQRLGILARLILQDGDLLAAQAGLLLDAWNRLISLLAELGKSPTPDQVQFDRERNRITREYLEELSAVWPLDALAGELDHEATDLVFHLEDALHEVPVAHLQVDGRPLFLQVRSVRQSLAVLMTEMQQEIERRTPNPGARLMTVSWFAPTDRRSVHQGNLLLHKGQSDLARHFGLEWYSASLEPPGRSGSVRAGLERCGGFRVVTLCGHGHPELGVQLADPEPWRGQGCPLDQVELLVLVSCSVGRLRETGTRDVEGLVVELAIHQARSVLACRWPVHACDAPLFANEVIARYLASRARLSQDDMVSSACLRARALNDTRKSFLGEEAAGQVLPARLDTVAAFELYGLG